MTYVSVHSIADERTRDARRAHAGFTLIELMVAMTAGAIAISSMFFISSASTHYFRVQQRLTNMQSSLRIAMDQLRRDVSRAGFGSTPSQAFYRASNQTTGVVDLTNFAAIRVIDAGSPAIVDPRGVHQLDSGPIEADALRLFGNYSTSSEYVINSPSGAAFMLSPNWHAFTRDFSNWDQSTADTTTVNAAAFNAAFRAGRLVRARSTGGSRYFSVVVGTNTGVNPSVTVAPPISPGGSGDTMMGGVINPASIIEYRVENATGSTVHANSTALGNEAAAGINTQLVRRELNPTDVSTLLDANAPVRVIAERVIHFNVDLLVNQMAARNVPPVMAPAPDAALNTFPERIFSAIITLAVRAPTADPRFPWILQLPGEVLTRFSFSAATAGAARVRFARAEIFLPNVADEWAR